MNTTSTHEELGISERILIYVNCNTSKNKMVYLSTREIAKEFELPVGTAALILRELGRKNLISSLENGYDIVNAEWITNLVFDNHEYKGHLIQTSNSGNAFIYKDGVMVGCAHADSFPHKMDNQLQKAINKIDDNRVLSNSAYRPGFN